MSFVNPFSPKTDDVSTIPAAELNAAGVDIERAIDGAGGGSYSPSTAITIGGSGINVTGVSLLGHIGNSTLFGTIGTSGAANIIMGSGSFLTWNSGSFLTVNSGTTFTVGTTETVVSGGKIRIESGATLQLDLGAITTISNTVEVESGGIIELDSGASLDNLSGGQIFNEGRITQFGTDASFEHRITELPDSNANIGASADIFLVRQNLATADRTYTLDKTTRVPHDGETCKATRFNPVNNNALFKREGGTLLGQIKGDGLEGGWIEFVYHSGDWRVLSYGGSSVASVANPAGTY